MREKLAKEIEAAGIKNASIHIQSGGSVAKAVRSLAEDNHVDLVVIGHTSGSGNHGRLRTDSYAIIRESPCPVVSV
jgi:nucleotide-binding universal stress UspA family protein